MDLCRRASIITAVLGSACAGVLGAGIPGAAAFEGPASYVATIGSYGTGPGQFGLPHSVSADAFGNLFVVDADYPRIEVFTYDGTFLRQWGSFGSGPGQFETPWNVLVTRSGFVYVSERNGSRVQKFTSDGAYVSLLGPSGSGPGQFGRPFGLAEDNAGNIYVGDEQGRVQKFSPTGAFLGQFGSYGSGPGQFMVPQGIAIKGDTVLVADGDNPRVEYFTTGGQYLGEWTFLLNSGCCGRGVAIDADGHVLVTIGEQLMKATTTGIVLARWGELGDGNYQFHIPIGVTVDARGDIYIADAINRRVQKYSGSSTIPLPVRPMTWGRLKSIYR